MKIILLLLLFVITSLNNYAQAALLKDINQGNASSSPSIKATFNGYTYFAANNGVNGTELWRTDGTENGTTLFKEFMPGIESGIGLASFFVDTNVLYFLAIDNGDLNLFKTDGTDSGTIKIKQFTSFQAFHDVISNELIFSAQNQLWKTDGTESGTVKLKDFPVFGGTRFVKSDNEIFFVAEESSSIGKELWKTDGTTTGTVLVKDIRLGANDSYPNNFTNLNGIVYFSANDGTNGTELWKTDGTESGTVLVKDIHAGSGSVFSTDTPIVDFNNEIFFYYGTSLWKSDGTDTGTIEVKNLETNIKRILKFNSKLYIFNYSNSFWVSDGTTENTTKVEVSINEFWHNGEYAIVGNQLFFQGNNTTAGYELWKTDGTEAGTFLVKDIHPSFDDNNIESIVELDGKAIFTASDGNWFGKELYISDGTEAGTSLLKDINIEGNNTSQPQNFFLDNDNVFFTADNGENGFELWLTTGTSTRLVKDINPGNSHSNPANFTALNGFVYFKAKTNESGIELWKTDGSEAGTVMVKDINPEEAKSGLANGDIVVLNNKLYFFANDGINGSELWESDGTEVGTILVKDINPGTGSSYRSGEIELYNNMLFFNAHDGSNDYELWSSDGTNIGTLLFDNINASSSASPDNFILFNNEMYFRANGSSGSGLWRTDGASTFFVTNKGYSNLTVSGNNLFFVSTYSNGGELWRTDGVSTIQVRDIKLGSGGSNGSFPNYLTDVNNILYFSANNGTNGVELWKSDGTEAGTIMVKDTQSGSDSSSITGIENFEGTVIISLGDNNQNRELWKSDGSEAGTVLLQDINPSTEQYGNGSNPQNFYVGNNILYFSADNGMIGSELWKLDQASLSLEKENLKQPTWVNLYPNPSSGVLNINVENQQIESVKIFNLTGKEVMQLSAKSKLTETINISQLSSGVYLIQLKTKTNVFSRKIIKN
jgi:ELWxxDGT repeat protein